ncbi:MAG: hypothetical protein GYA35_00960 [Thermoanaerobaculaceae bacterium]|nr:hypothetical protein [Thermoanaerobaculaceae bacterium]
MKTAKISQIIILATIAFLFCVKNFSEEKWFHAYDESQMLDSPNFAFSHSYLLSNGNYVLADAGGFDCFWLNKDAYVCDYWFIYVAETDKHGNLKWAKYLYNSASFGPPDYLNTGVYNVEGVIDNKDGTFIVVIKGVMVNSLSACSLLFDDRGNLISQKITDYDLVGECIKTPDDNYFIVGNYSLNSSAFAKYDVSLKKFVWATYFIDDAHIPVGKWKGTFIQNNNFVVIFSYEDSDSVRTALASFNKEGELVWAKGFNNSMPPPYLDYLMEPFICSSSDGGFFIISCKFPRHEGAFIMKLDAEGNIIWQRNVSHPSYPFEYYVYRGIIETEDGGVIVMDQQQESMGGNFIKIDKDGILKWVKEVDLDEWGNSIYRNGDNLVISTYGGYEGFTRRGGILLSLSSEGDYPENCYPDWSDDAELISTNVSITPLDLTFSKYFPNNFEADGDFVAVDYANYLSDWLVCGDKFPGIISIQKLSSPFRLKLTGWNFEKGCKVYINGEKVGSVEYKGKDKTNRTKIVLSGSNLKKKLPKGERVCIQVINPDGNQSDCFYFTR